jgi:hypothetical protein
MIAERQFTQFFAIRTGRGMIGESEGAVKPIQRNEFLHEAHADLGSGALEATAEDIVEA